MKAKAMAKVTKEEIERAKKIPFFTTQAKMHFNGDLEKYLSALKEFTIFESFGMEVCEKFVNKTLRKKEWQQFIPFEKESEEHYAIYNACREFLYKLRKIVKGDEG